MTAFGKFAKTLAKVRGGGGSGELARSGRLHSPSDLLGALLGEAAFVGPQHFAGGRSRAQNGINRGTGHVGLQIRLPRVPCRSPRCPASTLIRPPGTAHRSRTAVTFH